MRLALKELAREPRRFVPVGCALTLLVMLLVTLGGFLDGLELSQTGAYRAHDGYLLVFDDEAELQLQRSRLGPEPQAQLADDPAVAAVGGLDRTFSVVEQADGRLADVVLFGYDLATARLPHPPARGEAVIDAQLRRVAGVEAGDTIQLGPAAEPIVVAAVVDDVSQGAPTVWVASTEWRRLVATFNPAALPPEGSHQVVVVAPVSTGSPVGALRPVEGIEVATVDDAIAALDVVQQQSSTFAGIIGVTFVVTLVVVALFFALLTLERVRLYAVLKALGATTGELLRGVSVQAAGVSAVALVLGLSLSLLLTGFLPAELPIRVELARLAQIVAGTLITGVVGSLFTARRILRVDPADVIG